MGVEASQAPRFTKCVFSPGDHGEGWQAKAAGPAPLPSWALEAPRGARPSYVPLSSFLLGSPEQPSWPQGHLPGWHCPQLSLPWPLSVASVQFAPSLWQLAGQLLGRSAA